MFVQIVTRIEFVTLVAATATFLFLRHAPVGSRTYPGSRIEGAGNIPVSAPRYWIPREFSFPSFGTTLGLVPFPDPHFAATAPVQFEIVGPKGVPFAVAQGFDVNFRFERDNLRQSILALQVDREVYTLDAGMTCFRCWGDTIQLFFLGQSDRGIAFLIQKPLISGQEMGILLANWPVAQDGSAELVVDGTEGFPAAMERVLEIGVSPQAVGGLCRAQNKTISRFVLRYFEHLCE